MDTSDTRNGFSPKRSDQKSHRKLRSSGSGHSRNRYSDQGVFYPDKTHIRDERRSAARQRQKAKGEQSSSESESPPEMSGRPRNRGVAGRDGAKENDVEADLLARIMDGLKQAQKHSDESKITGEQIMTLEQDIKDAGHSTPDQHKQLDHLYRTQMRLADAEKKTLDDMDVINNIAILKTLQSSDEPAPRNNGVPKSRKGGNRPIVESDVIESPGPSPNEGRAALMNRVKGTGQRSSSVASQNRTTVKEEPLDTNRGVQAERAGQLIVNLDVFYKFPKGSKEVEGEGIHGIIKKVLQTKPIQYEVQDPETDQSGKQIIRKAVARELVPIPPSTATLPVFTTGSRVYAKYPDTDTFYNAEVRNFTKGIYTLIFEGEEDNRELTVDKRFVLDARVR